MSVRSGSLVCLLCSVLFRWIFNPPWTLPDYRREGLVKKREGERVSATVIGVERSVSTNQRARQVKQECHRRGRHA
eukprot:scaffold438_cov250-Pinguiococcus_pyrenoidosus.AAC.11